MTNNNNNKWSICSNAVCSKKCPFFFSFSSQAKSDTGCAQKHIFLCYAAALQSSLFKTVCSLVFALIILPFPFRSLYCFELFCAVLISQMIFQPTHHSFSMMYLSSTKTNISLDLKKTYKNVKICLSNHRLQDVKTKMLKLLRFLPNWNPWQGCVLLVL